MPQLTNRDITRMAEEADDLPPLTPEDLPLAPLFWSIVVERLVPKKVSEGGIYFSEESQKVEKIQNTIGRVLWLGDLAFKGTTASGIKLGDDSRVRKLRAGDYVLFARYTGQEVKFVKDKRDRTIIILSDTELLAVVSDPNVIRFWI